MRLSLLLAPVLLMTIGAASASAQILRDAVEGAWELNPQIKALEARREEFIARRKAGAAFFPDAPAVSLKHDTDQVIQNKRARATELELSTPLWLPGQGTATEQAAEANLARTDAQLALARLTVAGTVRDAAFKFALARAETDLADRRVESARATEADAVRRVNAGDAAPVDLDLARVELASAQAAARQQRAELAAAQAELLSLTGLRSLPRTVDEPLATTKADADTAVLQHPRMQAAQRSVDAARAVLQLAEISSRDSPEVGIVANRFRDIRGQEYDTTLGLRLRIPFATEARNAPRLAAARADLAEANAEFAAAQRELKLVLLSARETLAAAEEQTVLVQDRLKAARDAAARLQRSYEAGQIGLIEVIRSRVALFEAEAAAAQNRIALAQARSRVNQALGLVP